MVIFPNLPLSSPNVSLEESLIKFPSLPASTLNTAPPGSDAYDDHDAIPGHIERVSRIGRWRFLFFSLEIFFGGGRYLKQ